MKKIYYEMSEIAYIVSNLQQTIIILHKQNPIAFMFSFQS